MSDLDMMRYICTDPNAGNLIEPDEFDRAIVKIKADAIRAAGEAMEYALSFDDTYVHNSWLQDYAVNLEGQA